MNVPTLNPKISIVICTYRRYELTRQVVQSFCKQTAKKDDFELLIVDNDNFPNKEVKQIVEEVSSIVNISYLFENLVGLSNARNAGGKAALAEYVGYIDDDAVAPDNYVEKYLDIIDRLKPDIIGGPIYAVFNSKKPKWIRDWYFSSTNNGQSTFLNSNQYISGTSIGFRKKLLEEINWFDKNLGMTGGKIFYGEETMVQVEAWRKHPDLKVWFDQDLFINHLIPASKMKLSDKLRRAYSSGKSSAYIWITENQPVRIQKKAPLILGKTFFYLFTKGVYGLLFHDRKQYPSWQNYVYEVLSQYFASIGQEWQYAIGLFKKNKSQTHNVFLFLKNIYHRFKRVNSFYIQKDSRIIKYCNNSFAQNLVLTFDDGPHPVITREILSILKQYNVCANFFLLGPAIEKAPDLVKEIFNEGHILGNHGYEHVSFKTLSPELVISELERTDNLIAEYTGKTEFGFYRPPYGMTTESYLNWIKKNGKYTVLWSLDSYDSRNEFDVGQIAEKILRDIKNGDIVLFHDTIPNTADVLNKIIPILLDRKFSFINLAKIYK
jgi:peptidoglycan/xylan/chitin deacetylase (PgdA/CDA1 family)/GT2 family glycosyltransferase